MRRGRRLARGIAALVSRRRQDAELDAELRQFLEAAIDARVAHGMSREAAERAARLELGSAAAVKDWTRDVGWESRVESVGRDVRYAARVLLRNPAFTIFAVATLALGIGASTAIFSVAYGVTLRPLPYPDAERLVRLYESSPATGQMEHEVSIGAFHAWREGAPSLQSAALFSKTGNRFLAGADGTPVAVMRVSPAFFDVLGVHPAVGPGFGPERGYTRYTAEDEAVLAFEAWQRLFGGRADVVGRSLEFSGIGDNDSVRIVGVMPEGFAFVEPADVWIPSLTAEDASSRLMRLWRYDRAVARLRPDATVAQARSELTGIAARLAETYPDTNGGWTVTVMPLHEAITGQFGRRMWLLLASVGVVLLLACVNVAGLVLSRAVARERETSVRVALGAESWRLVTLWVAEAGLLSMAGGALGLLLAWAGVAALVAAAPPGIPRIDSIALDGPVLVFSAAAMAISLVACALAPLAAARRRSMVVGLRSGSASDGTAPGRQRARFALIVMQCAGAAALVVLAAMLTRSFQKLVAVDLGWEPAGVLSLRAMPPMPPELRRPWARYVEWSDRLIARAEAAPDIARAAITTQIPLSPHTYPAAIARGRGKQDGDEQRWTAVQHNVSDGYFETMGIRLLSGRSFGAVDRFSPAELNGFAARRTGSAIVTESTARALWPGQSAVGQALWLPNIDSAPWRVVVGVVEDIDFHAVSETGVHHVFVPWTQYPTGSPKLVVKGTRQAGALIPAVRAILQEVEPGTRVDQIAPLETLTARATAQPRFTSAVVALFGMLALVLAAVGVHGTLAYVVRARVREMGIRLALGASRGALLRRTLMQALVPALVGGIAGSAAAVGVARASSALLFDIHPLDPLSITTGGVVLLAVALAAAAGPARRAARVDPVIALRAE